MIKILVLLDKQNIITIEATGHSGYAEAGSDIICSAVSTLTQNLILGLEEVVKIKPIYSIDEDIPDLKVSLPNNLNEEENKNAQILMRSTYLGLKNLSDSYKKYISIKEKHYD